MESGVQDLRWSIKKCTMKILQPTSCIWYRSGRMLSGWKSKRKRERDRERERERERYIYRERVICKFTGKLLINLLMSSPVCFICDWWSKSTSCSFIKSMSLTIICRQESHDMQNLAISRLGWTEVKEPPGLHKTPLHSRRCLVPAERLPSCPPGQNPSPGGSQSKGTCMLSLHIYRYQMGLFVRSR